MDGKIEVHRRHATNIVVHVISEGLSQNEVLSFIDFAQRIIGIYNLATLS